MNNFSWIEIIGGSTIFGALTTAVGWLLGGRSKQKEELKSSEIDNKMKEIDNEMKEIDYAKKIRDLYEDIILKKDSEINHQSEQIKSILADAKEDREYFRGEISPLREELTSLRLKVNEQDKQIAELSLINAITKEAADSWEKKFNDLQKEHDQLKKAFDALKKSMK